MAARNTYLSHRTDEVKAKDSSQVPILASCKKKKGPRAYSTSQMKQEELADKAKRQQNRRKRKKK